MAELKTLCESNKYKQFFEVWHVFAFRISTPYLSSCNGAVRLALDFERGLNFFKLAYLSVLWFTNSL